MFKSLLIATAMLLVVGCSSKKDAKPADQTNQETTVTKTTGKAQTTCPVMEGNPINKELFVDVEGKRVCFCCGGCGDAIKKDPKKYFAQQEALGVTLEDAPK